MQFKMMMSIDVNLNHERTSPSSIYKANKKKRKKINIFSSLVRSLCHKPDARLLK